MLSNRLRRLVKDEINARVFLATHGYEKRRYSDAYHSMSPRARMMIRRLADHAIRIHDARYNDFIGFALFKMLFLNLALPWLLDLAKGTIAGSISTSIRVKIIDPILDRLIGAGRHLLSKRESDSYTDSIIRNIKDDFGTLVNVLRREGSAIAGKASFIFNKLKSVV